MCVDGDREAGQKIISMVRKKTLHLWSGWSVGGHRAGPIPQVIMRLSMSASLYYEYSNQDSYSFCTKYFEVLKY